MAGTLEEIIGIIHKHAPNFVPKIGMILGSGLSALADEITHPITIPYQAIGLGNSNVSGHASLLTLGYLQGVPVVCLKGRLHLYEGATYASIRTLVQVVKYLGAQSLIITAAVGSLRQEAGPGEVMMLTDHINFQPGNVLMGPNDETVGPRFVSLENAYDLDLRNAFLEVSQQMQIPVHQGVYFATLGPTFETPAEIRAFRTLGADVVGMSVVPEVIAARHCGLKVLGLTAVTNFAVGMSDEAVTHDGTLHYGQIAGRKMIKLIPEFVKRMGA